MIDFIMFFRNLIRILIEYILKVLIVFFDLMCDIIDFYLFVSRCRLDYREDIRVFK